MYSSASSWYLWANASLFSNGRTSSQGGNSSQPGPVSYRASKTTQPSLELPWHQICGHIQQRKLAALCYNMWMTSWQQLTTKTVLKGQSSYSVCSGKWDTKYPEKRLKSAKTKSNIWGSTSPKPVEPWYRKKTSCVLNPNTDYKKTEWWVLGSGWVLPNLDT
jgi:hypothetical protein